MEISIAQDKIQANTANIGLRECTPNPAISIEPLLGQQNCRQMENTPTSMREERNVGAKANAQAYGP
jgi:hypothetical protein